MRECLCQDARTLGDTLVLTPVDPVEGWRVTYERTR